MLDSRLTCFLAKYFFFLAAMMCCAYSTVAASAQQSDCAAEHEPNDTPVEATNFNKACVAGQLSPDDSQDLWFWRVQSPEKLWQLSIDAPDNGLTSVELIRVTFDDQRRVRKSEVLHRFATWGADADSPPLFLPAGDYYVGVAAAGARGPYQLRRQTVKMPDRVEREPNNQQAKGEPVTGTFSLRGSGDKDYFSWTLTEADAQQRWDLTLRAPLDSRFRLFLSDGEGKQIQYRLAADAGIRELRDLGLTAGQYLIGVESVAPTTTATYTLAATATGTRNEKFEEEPNARDAPYPITMADGVRGRLDENPMPADYFRFSVPESIGDRRTAIRLQTRSSEQRKLCLHTSVGREIQCRSAVGPVELPDLALRDEAYVMRVEGKADAADVYDVVFETTDAFRFMEETEPNDIYWTASELSAAGAGRGRLDGVETDVFRFETQGTSPQLWRIQTTGQNVAKLAILDASGDAFATAAKDRRTERVRLSRLLLLPGTHYLAVTGEDSDYVLRVVPQGPPDPSVEVEPNDSQPTAMPLGFGRPRRGVLAAGDNDHYRFRLFAREHVRLTVTPPADGRLRARFIPTLDLSEDVKRVDGAPMVYEGWLPPGDYGLWLDALTDSVDAHSVALERLNPFSPPVALDSEVSVDVRLNPEEIAAFSTWYQNVSGEVVLENMSDVSRTLSLETQQSNASVQFELDRSEINVEPGEAVSVPVALIAPPDLWSDVAISLQVAAREDGNVIAMGSADLVPLSANDPVQPRFAFWVPEPLLGAIDVSAIGLGAGIRVEGRQKQDQLRMQHNQFAPDSAQMISAVNLHSIPLPHTLTVDLRGDAAVPVVGLAIHPQGDTGTSPTAQQPNEFELQISMDGQRYESVLTDVLTPQRVEQFFAWPQPVNARFARLIVKSNYGDPDMLVLDSWKVLAPADTLPDQVNLADPSIGGHLVFHDLQSGQRFNFTEPESPLVESTKRWRLTCTRECQPSVFVVGFHEGRAAEITSIEWVEAALSKDQRLERVTVSVSADTPVGPWRDIGEIAIRDAPLGRQVLALEAPVLARYVRFAIPADSPFPSAMPKVVRVFERPVDPEYRSILGEWGWGEAVSSLEWQQRPIYPAEPPDDNNDSIATAVQLADQESGTVRIGKDEDFFQVDMPQDSNTLYFDLSGDPSIAVELELLDGSGRKLPLALDPEQSAPTLQRWQSTVEPGQRYWLRVYEPPRSVIFAWDTSGSVSPYRPVISQALSRFAATVKPGEEAVNLLPFGASRLLLEEWEDEPALIWRAMQNFHRDSESSATGETLLAATEALASRRGSRAIVLIGDMALPLRESAGLWEAFRVVQPHVYLMRVAHSGTKENSGLVIRHWASVNAGDVRDTPKVSDLEVGFERAATRLRRAARYSVSVATAFVEPPGPGTLRVVSRLVVREESAEPTVLGNTAVEVILDASGSMQARLGDVRRIDVAKTTLTDLTGTVLPPGLPVALRAFGHIEGNYSCRTDLVQELVPLDAARMADTIAGIQPQNLAGTPIAASLRLVAQDLRDATGQKLIVLVTDGEETCEGDPAAEIERLRASGTKVRLNIVGFAIDDDSLKATFAKWAELGGGTYIDAADGAALKAAISTALRVPFRILDESGEEVGNGVVNGDEIEIPAGAYTVEVMSEPPVRHEQVVVVGERDHTLTVGN